MNKQNGFFGRNVVCKFKYLKDLQCRTRLSECHFRTIHGHIDHFTGDKFIIFDEDDNLHIIHIEQVVEMHEYDKEE